MTLSTQKMMYLHFQKNEVGIFILLVIWTKNFLFFGFLLLTSTQIPEIEKNPNLRYYFTINSEILKNLYQI
jgi:hypothetical protein